MISDIGIFIAEKGKPIHQPTAMFKSYLNIAWRNMLRNKVYTLINLAGLTLGLTCAILVFCLVHYHLSFDNFHHHKDRIYRVVSETTFDMDDYSQGIPTPFGRAFRNDYDFAEKLSMRVIRGNMLITFNRGNTLQKFKENISYVEPDFFDIFNYPLAEGDARQLIADPHNALITEKLAHKFFPSETAVGKQFTVNGKDVFTVAGILKNIPVNSDNQQQVYLSFQYYLNKHPWQASDSSWGGISSSMQCFMRLKPSVKAADVEKQFPAMIHKYCSPGDAQHYFFFMQPLSDIHFNTLYDGELEKKYLWALAFIGLFLIATAGINFINLATAQSLNRSKEVGVRKTLGSSSAQMRIQFMAETAFLVLLAIVLSIGLAWLVLPSFNNLFSVHISLQLLDGLQLAGFIALLFVLVSLLAGYYPGLLLSRFRPVEALKGKITQKQVGGMSLRRGLIIMQFAIVQFMIIGAIVVARQMRYAIHSDLGFNKEGIVLLDMDIPGLKPPALHTFRNRLMQVAGVSEVSFCATPPLSEGNNWHDFRYNNRPKEEPFQVNGKHGDWQYLHMFGLQLVAGRNFYPSDTVNGYLVNETMVKKLHLASPADALGKTLRMTGVAAPIVGVVKDFHDQNFHGSISPLCISGDSKEYYTCAVKIALQNKKAILASIQQLFTSSFPDYIYSYSFFDNDIATLYETETNLLQLIELFAAIAVLIGCMGLFGLVSFMATQKRKEIGIRKVLGATVPGVLWLFGKEFTRLVCIAFAVAAPCATLLMQHWLKDFVFRISIDAFVFLLAIGVTLVMAIVTMGYTSLRAATANPVKSLRSE